MAKFFGTKVPHLSQDHILLLMAFSTFFDSLRNLIKNKTISSNGRIIFNYL